MVFDGQFLPAKKATEEKRRLQRQKAKKQMTDLIHVGNIEEARKYMKASVNITHEMALKLVKECRKLNVDCIIAPYEADAQLAYFNTRQIADFVISEDSDLLLFGCNKVKIISIINNIKLLNSILDNFQNGFEWSWHSSGCRQIVHVYELAPRSVHI